VDESLSDMERCALFLKSTERIQVLHAIHHLPMLITSHGRSLFQFISSPLKRAAARADEECSLELARAFRTILEESMLQVRFRPHEDRAHDLHIWCSASWPHAFQSACVAQKSKQQCRQQ
jgi:hypothetical protein